MSIDFEEDKSVDNVKEGDLTKITKLTNEFLKRKQIVRDLEAEIKGQNEAIKLLEETHIPNLMEEIGIADYSLTDGSKVEVKDIIVGSIPSQSAIDKEKDSNRKEEMRTRREECFAWLKKTKRDSIIKETMIVPCGRDEKLKRATRAALEVAGVPFIEDKSVHYQTLQSFLKEALAEGVEVPFETFAIFNGKKAIIKTPKKKA